MRSVPIDAGHAGVLRYDGGTDFVPQSVHGGARWSDEFNGRVAAREGVGQRGFFGGVTPPGPDGVDAVQTGQFDDEGDVGVVVIVGTAGDVYDDIGHADVFGVGSGRYDYIGSGWMCVEKFVS